MNFSTFTFHNVGQGLFFEGQISGKNIVYDCGNSSRISLLDDAIERYNSYNKGDIDILVISHLHMDHIRGILKLIKDRVVHNVIMPYISPAERLQSYMRTSTKDDKLGRFILSPYSKLSTISETVYVLTDGSPDNERSSEETNHQDKEDKVHIEFTDDESGVSDRKNNFHDKMPDNIHLVKYNGYNWISDWQLVFYNQPASVDKIDKLNKALYNELGHISLEEYLANNPDLSALRNIYKTVFNSQDFNATSLMMGIYGGFKRHSCQGLFSYHLSIDNRIYSDNKIRQCPCCLFSLIHNQISGDSFGILLTGDINFNQNFEQIRKRYGDFKDLNVSLIPHHGSSRNWNDQFRLIPTNRRPIYVISTGYRYNYHNLKHFQIIASNLVIVDRVWRFQIDFI